MNLKSIKEAYERYPWMIYVILTCLIAIIILMIYSFIKRIRSNKINNDGEDSQQKTIDEVLFEDNISNSKMTAIDLEEPENELIETQLVIEEKKEEELPKTRIINGKYEVFLEGDSYKFVLKASNGEVLIESELYKSRDTVIQAINSVKRNLDGGKISLTKDKRNLYQFKLLAGNNRVLVVSANYSTEKRALSAIESFKRFAATSPILEVENKNNTTNMEQVDIATTESKNGGKFFVTDEGNGYVFQLLANNGEILCKSELYQSKANCIKGIDTFKLSIKDGKFYIIKDKRGYFQFKLYSKSNRIIAVGETYQLKTRAISSVNSVCSFVEKAILQS